MRFVRAFHQPWSDRIEGDEHGDVEYGLRQVDWKRHELDADR